MENWQQWASLKVFFVRLLYVFTCFCFSLQNSCGPLLDAFNINWNNRVPSSTETSTVKRCKHSILFVFRSREKTVVFSLQPITANVLQFKATCNWPTQAATIYTVCGILKSSAAYLMELAVPCVEMPPKPSKVRLHITPVASVHMMDIKWSKEQGIKWSTVLVSLSGYQHWNWYHYSFNNTKLRPVQKEVLGGEKTLQITFTLG